MEARKVSLIFLIILLISPVSQIIAEEEEGKLCEIAGSLLSIYFRAYDYVSSRVESSNLSLDANLSVPSMPNLGINLSKTMSIGDLLNLSYSLALQANSSIGEGNCSQASFLTKKALNLLKFVLKEVQKNEPSNLTSTPIGSMIRLQVAFERHKRLLFKLNLSLQKIKHLNETNLNLSLFNQLYLNASMMLDNGSMIAFYNTSEAAKMLAMANKIRAEMKKEVVKCCQIAKAEEMLNKTLSKLNLTAIPEELESQISNLTKEFNEAEGKGDVKKIKEILKEVKKAVANGKQLEGKGKGKTKQVESVQDMDLIKEKGKGKGKKLGQSKKEEHKGKGKDKKEDNG